VPAPHRSSADEQRLDEVVVTYFAKPHSYTTDDIMGRIMELTRGGGVDLVFKHVGGELFQKAIASLAPNGRLVTCGAHGGEVVPFDIIPFFRAQHTIVGSFVYERHELEKVLDFAARGLLEPLVARTFPLSDARAAFELLESRDFFGKILLRP